MKETKFLQFWRLVNQWRAALGKDGVVVGEAWLLYMKGRKS